MARSGRSRTARQRRHDGGAEVASPRSAAGGQPFGHPGDPTCKGRKKRRGAGGMAHPVWPQISAVVGLADMSKSDPVRTRFFIPVERAEKWSDWLFYVGVPLSIAALFVHRESHPVCYTVLFILFAVDVLALFIVGTAIKLYF